ncbi:hypothetical protein AWB75_04527 [Caballeronia catudaia]|uniref:Cell wall surface anchor family protein n=2 Tax=Caballeronia catudaia TaxID=1777136 RepID=A0A158C530_9BURK|nr:hypothetical protein AWB75_04527 [Caballeronia catudaia]
MPGADAETKLARAARSAQRLAQLSEDARGGETLDLFAEDTERAQCQALNTDIRQGTFEGFELPDVFLAAVQSNCGTASAGVIAGESAAAAKRAARGTAASVAPEQGLFQDELPHVDAARPDQPKSADKTGAIAAAVSRPASVSTSVAPESTGSTLIAHDHGDREPLAQISAPELDRARVTAFADTIDALHAVMAEQRTSAAAHARRMRTMLTIIVCVMLVTVATGIAQTAVLLRMSRDGKLQQDRTEQLMLNQQATLASLFDTDSATLSLRRAPDTPHNTDDASPVQPVSAVPPDATPKKHAHHRASSTAH